MKVINTIVQDYQEMLDNLYEYEKKHGTNEDLDTLICRTIRAKDEVERRLNLLVDTVKLLTLVNK